jgi:hypothetical protein
MSVAIIKACPQGSLEFFQRNIVFCIKAENIVNEHGAIYRFPNGATIETGNVINGLNKKIRTFVLVPYTPGDNQRVSHRVEIWDQLLQNVVVATPTPKYLSDGRRIIETPPPLPPRPVKVPINTPIVERVVAGPPPAIPARPWSGVPTEEKKKAQNSVGNIHTIYSPPSTGTEQKPVETSPITIQKGRIVHNLAKAAVNETQEPRKGPTEVGAKLADLIEQKLFEQKQKQEVTQKMGKVLKELETKVPQVVQPPVVLQPQVVQQQSDRKDDARSLHEYVDEENLRQLENMKKHEQKEREEPASAPASDVVEAESQQASPPPDPFSKQAALATGGEAKRILLQQLASQKKTPQVKNPT